MTQHDPAIAAEFDRLISDPDTGEQDAQDFIERHPALFFPRWELNHGVHLNLLISKFQIDTSLQADLAYLTKSSAVWWLVLVELESPSLRLFTKDAQPTAEFTHARTQVGTWRTFVNRNKAEVVRRVGAIRKPLSGNQVVIKYMLIAGRTAEFRNDQRKIDAFHELQDTFPVLTYDSLLHAYQANRNLTMNVISQIKSRFTFKHRHRDDTDMFSWLSPDDFQLLPADITHYKARGYDIDSWLAGRHLVADGKQTRDKFLPSVKQTLSELANKDKPAIASAP